MPFESSLCPFAKKTNKNPFETKNFGPCFCCGRCGKVESGSGMMSPDPSAYSRPLIHLHGPITPTFSSHRCTVFAQFPPPQTRRAAQLKITLSLIITRLGVFYIRVLDRLILEPFCGFSGQNSSKMINYLTLKSETQTFWTLW